MNDGDDQVDQAAVCRHTRRLLSLWVGLALPCGAAPVLIATLTSRGDGSEPARHDAVLPVVLTVITLLIVLILGIGMLLWLARRPSYRRFVQYGLSERRATFKAVRAGRPLDERQAQLARATLDVTQRQRWLIWVLAAATVMWSLNGFVHRHELFGKLELGLGMTYLLGLPLLRWQRERVVERIRQALDRGRPF